MMSKSGYITIKDWFNLKIISMNSIYNKLKLYIKMNAKFSDSVVNKRLNKMPGPKPSLPLIGTGWQYYRFVGKYDLHQMHDVLFEKFAKYGTIFKEEYQWGKAIVNICDPKDIEKVFRAQGKCPMRPTNDFVIHHRMQNPAKYPSVGIANMNGLEWYEKRQLLAPALLKLNVAEHHIPNLQNICDDFIEYIFRQLSYDELNKIYIIEDFREFSYNFVLESIGSWCLDIRLGCLCDNSLETSDGLILVEATKDLFEAYQKLFYSNKIWKYIQTDAYKQLVRSETCIHNTLSKYVDSALNAEKSSVCLMNELLKMETISVDEMKVTLMDFIIGGLFTVSNSLNFICYHLAKNITIQQKLFQEIKQVINQNKQISHQSISKMKYLKACIKESFRLTSTIPGIMRILPTDIQLSGYEIPAGTLIFSNFMTTCRSEQYFSNPKSFIPERWIGEAKNECHPFSMIQFGFGNRMCVGRRFAQLHIEMAVISIIRQFELSIDENDEIDLICNFLIVPNRKIKFKIKKRNT